MDQKEKNNGATRNKGASMLLAYMRREERTRAYIARHIGCTRSAVADWLKPGHYKPSPDLRIRLEKKFGIPFESWDYRMDGTHDYVERA